MLESILETILLGITGGVISSLVVSRIFMIDSAYREEIKTIEKFFFSTSYFSGIVDFSARLQEEIYDRERAVGSEITSEVKAWKIMEGFLDGEGLLMLKTRAENLKTEMFGVYVKDKQLEEVRKGLEDLAIKISRMSKCTFGDLRECQDKISAIRKRFYFCMENRRKTFLSKVIFDKLMIALYIVIIVLIILFVISKIKGL